MLRAKKTKGKVVLLAPGYRKYEGYLKSVNKKDIFWSKLRGVDGEISEAVFSDFSQFRFKRRDANSDPDQGLLLTDVDLDKAGGHSLQRATTWRINKSYAQRIHLLALYNSPLRLNYLLKLEKDYRKDDDTRKTIVFDPIEKALLPGGVTYDYKDFAYETRFFSGKLSRDSILQRGIYSRIGKYFRSIFCLAPMPDASGSVDAITTAVLLHMLAVIPRNFLFKDIFYQREFAKAVLKHLDQISSYSESSELVRQISRRNVCAAIGVGETDMGRFRSLYEVGVRSFRLYSIATDSRVIEMTQKLIGETKKLKDNSIELFVGQITSITQLNELLKALGKDWSFVDGVFIGNGGGSRCKTAETGMKVATPQLSYQLRNHPKMAGKSIIFEGGLRNEPASVLLLGASGLSCAAGISGGCLEAPGGALYIHDGKGYWKPYRGEASPSAKIMEGYIYPTGDAKQIEGANGFIRMEKKYPSMCGRILNLNEWLAQSFVKLGVTDLVQLHALGTKLTRSEVERIFKMNPNEIPDIVKVGKYYIIPFPLGLRSQEQKEVAKAYGVGDQIQVNEVADLDFTVRIP